MRAVWVVEVMNPNGSAAGIDASPYHPEARRSLRWRRKMFPKDVFRIRKYVPAPANKPAKKPAKKRSAP